MPLSLRLITYYHLSVARARDFPRTYNLHNYPHKKKSGYLIRSNFSYPKIFQILAGYPVARHTRKQKSLTAIIPTAPQKTPVSTSLPLSLVAQFIIFRSIFNPSVWFAYYSIVSRLWYFPVCNFPAYQVYIVSPYLFFNKCSTVSPYSSLGFIHETSIKSP